MKKKHAPKKRPNIVESVEFLTEEDMLVAELDKRLSFSAFDLRGVGCEGKWVCPSLCDNLECTRQQPPAVAGVRG